ncbi:MAG TPA: cytochrome C biogenesis protein, partial [Lutibacter sp.]|nr:cytochrome C biogenesis protein [Lutibacter sp.]
YIFSYNKPIIGGINFTKTTEGLILQSAFDGTYMEMQSREITPVAKDSLSKAQFKKLYRFNNMGFVVMDNPVKGSMKYVSAPTKDRKKYPYHALYLNVSTGDKSEQVMVLGAKNATASPKMITLNGLNFTLKYGSREIKTPFSIKLRDFQLERYPGSNSPSSFASEVTVMDKDETFDYRIFMNHVLDYKGFRFFQASYDPDELGTHLSVNHDYWGTLLTYIGYFLMALGMFVSLFWKGTRFSNLSKKLRKLSSKKLTIFILLFGITSMSFGQETLPKEIKDYVVSKEHADKFGRLLIQDYQGRIKPINTYSIESLRKIYKKDTYKGLTAEQVILSAQLNPRVWSTQELIHAKSERLENTMISKLKIKDGLASIIHFYNSDNSYVIEKNVAEAHQKKFMDRTATDKELINLDERANLWVQVLNGAMMRIYPKENDSNNKWFAGTNSRAFVAQDTMLLKMHRMYMTSLQNALKTDDYGKADEFLGYISEYQKKLGASIIPSDSKIDLEIKYNRWGIFTKLMFYYMLIGFIFLILAFIDLFKPNSKIVNILLKVFSLLTILGMAGHVFGLGLRWYLSGHEPWSNGYEAVVFVAFITTLAGLIFSYKKSKFTIASTVLFASFLLSIAHGSMMSPEITNLVPVLKSYWLMIHVAIITASYGFLGLGSLLGFVVLFLYILRTPENAKRFNQTINELTYINESTITVGLHTLTIGTFLGGVWAAESWGRYWSWDPKEVWSLISMMVYIFVLHMRLVPGLKGKFAFNLASLFSISTLIMTFFGVNFYLSGMHSYATGDPVPVPNWIYFAIAFFVLFAIVSYWKYYSFKKLKK